VPATSIFATMTFSLGDGQICACQTPKHFDKGLPVNAYLVWLTDLQVRPNFHLVPSNPIT